MGRINGLVKLVFTDLDQLRPTGPFQSEGIRADILRAIVVFLHATFEDVLRSQVPKPNKSLSFYSRSDIEKALKESGIDSKPFQPLYPPLTQMAKRRKRIVHEADLTNRTDVVSEKWGLVDDWQLIMWLMAVAAFYYQLRMAAKVASVVEMTMYERLGKAMQDHVEFGKQLLSFPNVPPELRVDALQKTIVILQTIASTLKVEVSNLILSKG